MTEKLLRHHLDTSKKASDSYDNSKYLSYFYSLVINRLLAYATAYVLEPPNSYPVVYHSQVGLIQARSYWVVPR